jgi:hypothetical protein
MRPRELGPEHAVAVQARIGGVGHLVGRNLRRSDGAYRSSSSVSDDGAFAEREIV